MGNYEIYSGINGKLGIEENDAVILRPSSTPSVTPSISVSPTPSITPSITPTVTPSITPTPSSTPTPLYIDSLLIAGGGSAGFTVNFDTGGGGGGGYIETNSVLITLGTYPVVIGAGGIGEQPETNGENTTFNGNTALGGGHGDTPNVNGAAGGCGGGAGWSASYQTYGGAGSVGYDGGNGGIYLNTRYGGGGGGLGSAGTFVGVPGEGLVFSGFSLTEFGVGGGCVTTAPLDGTPNTGNGGEGRHTTSGGGVGASGGSGIVIIKYAGLTPRATGGTITTDSGYTFHTFTSSGNFIIL